MSLKEICRSLPMCINQCTYCIQDYGSLKIKQIFLVAVVMIEAKEKLHNCSDIQICDGLCCFVVFLFFNNLYVLAKDVLLPLLFSLIVRLL